MALQQPREARGEPERPEGEVALNDEAPPPVVAPERAGATREELEPLADRRQIVGARLGEMQRPRAPGEELPSQVCLEAPDMLRYRGLGHVQLRRSLGEGEMPSRCLEGTQPVERRKGRIRHGR